MQNVDRDEFFREVTVRICSSLDIKIALRRAFEYMSLKLPLDTLTLSVRDASRTIFREMANISAGLEDWEEIIQIPKDVWKRMQQWKPVPTVITSDRDDHFRLLAPYIKLAGNSMITLPLLIDKEWLGSLILRTHGEGKYDDSHLELLTTVTNPFAIALANALSYEKLLKYRDKLLDDNRFLNQELTAHAGEEIIGENAGLKNVMEVVRQVAPLNNTVLLLGETGTGKEVIANAIHSVSTRKNGPFIKVNCGAIPESLIDSALFGHEKGAFTGAVSEYRGRFERADGGTIFLDEIGELPLRAQVRLLRVLQTHEIERVGGSRAIPVDIRVIAATHRNLGNMVAAKEFREDLWFRLNVFPIILPPLRQRREDILPLARYFVRKKSLDLGISAVPDIAPGAYERLQSYEWLGNVRELENVVERELILHRGGNLLFESLAPRNRKEEPAEQPLTENSSRVLKLDEAIASHLSMVLKMTHGKIHGPTGAAELLDMNPSTLRWRLDKLGIKYKRDKKDGDTSATK